MVGRAQTVRRYLKTDVWIFAWHDLSGDADRDITKVALSAADAVAAIRRILEGETVLEEIYDTEHGSFSPGEEQPAFAYLFGAEDPVAILKELRGELEQECENGKIVVSRTVSV